MLISIVALATFTTSACRDRTIATYRIAKEDDHAGHAHAPGQHGAPASGPMAMPTLSADAAHVGGASLAWKAPAHWRTKPGSSMRKGSYAVGPEGEGAADLAITAFPGDVGGEVANVNRWRGQLGLGELAAAEATGSIVRTDAGELPIGYIDIVNDGKRMLAAFVPFDGATWFFKLTGPDALVASEKSAYVQFLQSIRPAAPAPAVATTNPPTP